MSLTDSPEFSIESISALPHETPYFLFSKRIVEEKIAEFKRCFPDALIQYAMKANSAKGVLEAVSDAGIGFEIASRYELEYLREIGVKARHIVYGTSVKPASHIKECFDYGVEVFAFDSPSELDKIAAAAPGSKVYVRIRVDDTGSVFRFSEKFGTSREQIVPLLTHAKELGLIPYGVSFHVGSQASNPMAWGHALEYIKEPLSELTKAGIDIEVINMGGGFPTRYASSENAPELAEIAWHINDAHQKLGLTQQLMFEPGRKLVAEAGVMVASVIARVERGESTWLFLDAGVYNGLFEVMAYQGLTRYSVTSLRPSYNSGEKFFAIAGPTGDSPDIVTREALLPSDIDVGDKLVIHKAGAYSLTVTSRFNGFPQPDVYYA